MSVSLNFREKVVLVTGSTSGIGEAAAKLFAKAGALVFIHGRSAERANKIVQAIREEGGKAEPAIGDLSEASVPKKIIDEVINKADRLDILINNAGIASNDTFESVKLEEYDQVINVNVRSAIALTQLALPHLKQSKGTIVNLSSILSSLGVTGLWSYEMSKSAIAAFTTSLALELAPFGIRVNAISPGVVVTEMTSSQMTTFEKYAKAVHPLGRLGQPEDIGNAILFLASDLASWITGVNLLVDGGNSLKNVLQIAFSGELSIPKLEVPKSEEKSTAELDTTIQTY